MDILRKVALRDGFYITENINESHLLNRRSSIIVFQHYQVVSVSHSCSLEERDKDVAKLEKELLEKEGELNDIRPWAHRCGVLVMWMAVVQR